MLHLVSPWLTTSLFVPALRCVAALGRAVSSHPVYNTPTGRGPSLTARHPHMHLGRHLVRAMQRPLRPVPQSGQALGLVAAVPGVEDLPVLRDQPASFLPLAAPLPGRGASRAAAPVQTAAGLPA